MDTNTVSPLPPPEAPLAMMENEKTPPPRSPGSAADMPPPPDEKRYDDDADNSWSCGSWFEYIIVVVLSTIFLIGALVLVIYWAVQHGNGFAWSEDPQKQFNLHPVLMVAGFITLSGFSILLYRLCRCLKHIYVKLLHMFFHACAVPCVVIGFLAVLDSHNLANPPIPNFYSLHSWLGLVTMGLFATQFVVGFFSFLVLLCCEDATYSCRAAMVPIHASFGLANFMLAIATCVSGITEKAIFKLKEDYSKWTEEGIILNALGATLIALGILVCFAVRRSNAPATAKVYVTERL
ncbi:plasma membrane ascorbate-dependent reductase CYBRD1 isoform X1 [Lutzomyia longipalpis]|uniref:plasma membrane ascorbate-dependent reductase CYBRD1 isoform X1 n=1 Tax=Lutzomyia longipalpis TaxID=7200 RepID=UPI00248409BA|nr:plasma membrane ascorbate-dependent reductase CYBRD1 isoform X1 [Lutzomyia longipalpis]XP_055690739.1 plasma membrane ascorbate-dependent reductase CYBRD1 isoform X1 [Lutzomyia longipalpis]